MQGRAQADTCYGSSCTYVPFILHRLALQEVCKVVAVTRRMITDLEMKGVLREAQSCFNLCVNLRPGDNMFQEFTRTFMNLPEFK